VRTVLWQQIYVEKGSNPMSIVSKKKRTCIAPDIPGLREDLTDLDRGTVFFLFFLQYPHIHICSRQEQFFFVFIRYK
jgi:hypothetical protein